MSDVVLIVIALTILVAVIVALKYRGGVSLRWGNRGISAQGKRENVMTSTGRDSVIERARMEGHGGIMTAEEGGHIRDAEMASSAKPPAASAAEPRPQPPAEPTPPSEPQPPTEPEAPRANG